MVVGTDTRDDAPDTDILIVPNIRPAGRISDIRLSIIIYSKLFVAEMHLYNFDELNLVLRD